LLGVPWMSGVAALDDGDDASRMRLQMA